MLIQQTELSQPAQQDQQVPPVGFRFATFKPSEAEAITGAGVEYQRDLRKRGMLESAQGWSRYDLFSLAYLQGIRLLAGRGGPKVAQRAAELCAWGTAWRVLAHRAAYQGDHQKILSWDVPTYARIQAWEAATAFAYAPHLTAAEKWEEVQRIGQSDGFHFGMQASWMRLAIFNGLGCQYEMERFFIWWANDTVSSVASVDAAFNSGLSDNPQFAAAVVVLDCDALAAQLIERAGRPFVTVEIDP